MKNFVVEWVLIEWVKCVLIEEFFSWITFNWLCLVEYNFDWQRPYDWFGLSFYKWSDPMVVALEAVIA